MKLRSRRSVIIGSAVGLVLLGKTCNFHPAAWKNANMTPQGLRVQAVLSKLETHCFGRFLIDLPEGATVAWGKTLDLEIAPHRAAEVDQLVAAMEDARKKEKRYPLNENLNLYFETRQGPLPHMRHVVSQRDFGSHGLIRIDTYFTMGDSLVATQSETLTDHLDRAIAEVEDLARRLRPRLENEIPTDSGQCIDNGFVADRPNAANEEVGDFISVGYRLKDPSDVHLSIDLQPANAEWAKPGLDKRLNDSEADARKRGDFNLYGDLTTFRRAKRAIHDWKDGFEFLTKTPNQKDSKAYHDFWMIFPGQIDKLYHPYVDIRMSTGVKKNTSGNAEPSISDDEAIALWDALTSTIRVRPTTVAKADAAEETPIGALALTGRPCPRTGLWQCADESSPVRGGRRQWFRAGEILPQAVLLGEPSLWQRVRGNAPTHATKTVWKLVSLDAPGDAATLR